MDATLYIIYMIIGSEFKSIKVNNKLLEQRYKLYYIETKNRIKLRTEAIVIKYLENTLKTQLPDYIWDSIVEISFGVNFVRFYTGIEELTIIVNDKNMLSYEFKEVLK